jgi:hypothetical protein
MGDIMFVYMFRQGEKINFDDVIAKYGDCKYYVIDIDNMFMDAIKAPQDYDIYIHCVNTRNKTTGLLDVRKTIEGIDYIYNDAKHKRDGIIVFYTLNSLANFIRYEKIENVEGFNDKPLSRDQVITKRDAYNIIKEKYSTNSSLFLCELLI